MEIGGLLNARHAAAADAQMRQLQQTWQHPHQLHDFGALSHTSMPQQPSSQIFQTNSEARSQNLEQEPLTGPEFDTGKVQNETTIEKNYLCSHADCNKRFARRSDLGRHERIHTGERPHTCDYALCGKSFIQRSALTVHMRVHTGEKPHFCETCDKAFSDSSSLARHRRIHSGQKPYKCPKMNCQKTFTRKTTLNRHRLWHEQGADPDSKGATRLSNDSASSRSETVSPGQQTLSPSPLTEHIPMVSSQRSTSDTLYLSQPSLPPHMRTDYKTQYSPRSTPSLSGPSLASLTSNPQSKPSPTSHPNAYGPPQPLEPPANGIASGSASPHLGPAWGSPNHGTLPSPGSLTNFDYADSGFGAPSLFFPGNSIRRPQSTEPEDYGIRPRGSHAHGLSHIHNPVSMPIANDWSPMPVGALHGIKQERFVM